MNSKNTSLREKCKNYKNEPVYLVHRNKGKCRVTSCSSGALYVEFEDGTRDGFRFPYSVDTGELVLDVEREKQEILHKAEEEARIKAEQEKLKQEAINRRKRRSSEHIGHRFIDDLDRISISDFHLNGEATRDITKNTTISHGIQRPINNPESLDSFYHKTSDISQRNNPRVNFPNVERKIKQVLDINYRALKDIMAKYSRVIFFDVETTGLQPKTEQIIEFSAIIFNNNESYQIISKLIALEGAMLSSKISLLTGIDDVLLASYGEPRTFAENEIATLFQNPSSLIFGYNLTFDLAFINEIMKRRGLSDFLERHDFIDAMTVYKDRAPYPHKLENACQTYHVQSLGAHCSLYDALSLFEVIIKMHSQQDITRWINLFGYNPKWGISTPYGVQKIKYFPQQYKNIF